MGSASSIDYYMSQQLQAPPAGSPHAQHQPQQAPFYEGKVSAGSAPSSAPGQFAGTQQSAGMLLRQQLLNAGEMLWRNAPGMLSRLEVLERENQRLRAENSELRGFLSNRDGLLEELDRARQQNRALSQQLDQAAIAGSPRAHAQLQQQQQQQPPPFGQQPVQQQQRPIQEMTPNFSRQRGGGNAVAHSDTPGTFATSSAASRPTAHPSHDRRGSTDREAEAFRSELPRIQQSPSPKARTAAAAFKNPFSVGDAVEVDFHGKGKFYPGSVKFAHKDGTVDIVYNDGDTEDSVPIHRVRALPGSVGTSAAHSQGRRADANAVTPVSRHAAPPASSSSSSFKVGDKVTVDYKGSGNFYPGSVTEVMEMSPGAFLYSIGYEDGDSEEMVPAERMTKQGQQTAVQAAAAFEVGDVVEVAYKGTQTFYFGKILADRGSGLYDIKYDDGEEELAVVEGHIRRPPGSGPLAVGTRVNANFRDSGKYFPGTVTVARPDGTYDVQFDDGDSDQKVKRKFLRELDQAAGAAAGAMVPAVDEATANAGQGLSEEQRDRVMQIFRWADHDRDAYLNEQEFQLWGDKVGMPDLYDQYGKLCEMLSCNASLGISMAALLNLYAEEFKDEIEAQYAMTITDIDLPGQFRIADRDGDGRLNVAEAQVFSDLKGIPFLGEDGYKLLCSELKSPGGLTETQFESLILNFKNLESKAQDDADMLSNVDVVRSVIQNY